MTGRRVAGKYGDAGPSPMIIVDQRPIDDKEAAADQCEEEDWHHFVADVICKYRGNGGRLLCWCRGRAGQISNRISQDLRASSEIYCL